TVPRHPLADPLHIGLQLLVGVARVLAGDLLGIAPAQVDLLLLAHHHEVGLAGGRVDRTTGQLDEQRQQQQQTQFHGSTSSIAAWLSGSIQRACPGCTPPRRARSITQPRASTSRPTRACNASTSKWRSSFGSTRSTSGPSSSIHRPPRLRCTWSTRPRTRAKPPPRRSKALNTCRCCQRPRRCWRAVCSAL